MQLGNTFGLIIRGAVKIYGPILFEGGWRRTVFIQPLCSSLRGHIFTELDHDEFGEAMPDGAPASQADAILTNYDR